MISVKTASVHVSHILSKLDVPTRVEAAAIAHRIASEWARDAGAPGCLKRAVGRSNNRP